MYTIFKRLKYRSYKLIVNTKGEVFSINQVHTLSLKYLHFFRANLFRK